MWIILLLTIVLVVMVSEFNKEPNIWYGVRKIFSVVNPFKLAFNINLWILIILIMSSSGLFKLSKY